MGIRLLCFLLLGDVLQDQVSLIHQVFVSSSPGTRWSTWYILCHLWWAEHYPYYWCSQGLDIWQTLLRWQNLEARLGCLWDFPSWASLMCSSTSHALPKLFFSSYVAKNIAKGTTDPRVEFISQILNILQFQNLNKAFTSKSQPNISILTKLKLKASECRLRLNFITSTKHQQQKKKKVNCLQQVSRHQHQQQ